MKRSDAASVTSYVLAIDQAAASGWAVVRIPDGAILDSGTASGELRGFADRARVVALFLALAGDAPVRAIFEDHSDFYFGRGNGSPASLIGMGKPRGRWEESLLRVMLPAHIKHDVQTKVWRRAVLGLPSNVRKEHAKASAIAWASAKLGRKVDDDNEAEAVCIAAWAARNLKAGRGREKAKP